VLTLFLREVKLSDVAGMVARGEATAAAPAAPATVSAGVPSTPGASGTAVDVADHGSADDRG